MNQKTARSIRKFAVAQHLTRRQERAVKRAFTRLPQGMKVRAKHMFYMNSFDPTSARPEVQPFRSAVEQQKPVKVRNRLFGRSA